MQFLKDLLHKNEHLFLKGGKFEKFYPLYEMQESFFFTPRTVTNTNVHVRDSLDSKRLMITVVIALLPCLFFGAYNVGYQEALAAGETLNEPFKLFINGMIQILPIIIVSYTVGGLWEVLFAVIRRHEINEGFLVTGMLFPLVCPPSIPLWQVAAGISFGVVVGKEIFGGTGMNVLNPALTARAFLYFSYPVQISGDKVWIMHEAGNTVDGFSGATPLSVAASTPPGQTATDVMANFSYMAYDVKSMFIGLIPGSIGETSALMCLIGAVILIATGVGSWRIMVSVLVGAAVTAFGLNLIAGDTLPGVLTVTPVEHMVMGGLLFGAVFMATDPVSAARTTMGKWIYGFLIGIMTILIRLWNPAYPEGVMLAILFMNIFAPLIDYFVVKSNINRRLSRVAS
ncbi:NADH:ubiquinone reductase (Na(+)-transporting) subunit B [Sulfidibacter corallicola]|uniref:Na(+)-translocating NADH-quinone reductase subunit B n=1 Tax=Sulfidibacter corallicola TaxID=2818388 RepID=A0A8A4TVG7_SULCO|nr:NADH:ubiquinone reductase (Na(+)-transporting) subunit B [Sulfidibacter corallicola]QTD53168.1 NADH:ubiquinone reductase (Na(+)-transporting) subunit B [Sulfidibacter corallicola]